MRTILIVCINNIVVCEHVGDLYTRPMLVVGSFCFSSYLFRRQRYRSLLVYTVATSYGIIYNDTLCSYNYCIFHICRLYTYHIIKLYLCCNYGLTCKLIIISACHRKKYIIESLCIMLQCNSLLINDPPREIFQKVDKVSFRITVNHLSVFYKRLPIHIYKKQIVIAQNIYIVI